MVNLTISQPRFSDIKVEQIEPQLDLILSENREAIQSILNRNEVFTWQNLMQPLSDLADRLNHFWSPISHLNAVLNSPALREAYNACLPKLSEYSTEIGHNQKLYEAILSISQHDEYDQLDKAQKKVIENDLRDFKLAGITLAPEKKKRFAELAKQLSKLTSQFAENVLDATQAWTKHIENEKDLAGLPEHTKQAAKVAAQQKKLSGWLLTLEMPVYFAVISYADSAPLRQEMYTAYTTRASDQAPNSAKWDNSQIMEEILTFRLEIANLLGFNNFAEESLATKMVHETNEVLKFLNQLLDASLNKAKDEYQQLCRFAKEQYNIEQLNAWDLTYYSEKLRQHYYAISQEELRPYFPEYKVLNGLFAIVNRLFGITIEQRHDVDIWHPDARYFFVHDRNGNLCSGFYLDLYARPNKRGGAWMDECQVRRILSNGDIQMPIAYVTCNFNPPAANEPALFNHDEVLTLFHEFGHALQHMLTRINYPEVSGINGVPWDAVEVASQFLENWAWEKQSLDLITEHYKTKEKLPDDLYQRMQKAKNFQAGLQMVRQLEFALFDFNLHLHFDPKQNNQIQQILDQVRAKVNIVPVPKFNRFQHSFSHIFAGGYAAGYYSYKWAEVMASDAFSLFAENGIFDQETSGKFFDTILSSGGAEDPMDLFIKFRGRKPQIESLLKETGIISEELENF